MKKINLSCLGADDLNLLAKQIKEELLKRHNGKSYFNHDTIRRIKRIHKLAPLDPDELEEKTKQIKLFNSQVLARTPDHLGDPQSYEQYLSPLIHQDWEFLYPRDTEEGEYYVYAHVDPRLKVFLTSDSAGGNYGGRPFYIGKGTGNRAFDLKRNEGHGKRIKDIVTSGFSPLSITRILFEGISEQKALEIESKLIYFFGTAFSLSKKGWLLNLSEPRTPEFIANMKATGENKSSPYQQKEDKEVHTTLTKEPAKTKQTKPPLAKPKSQRPYQELQTIEGNECETLPVKTYNETEVREIVNKAIRERLTRWNLKAINHNP